MVNKWEYHSIFVGNGQQDKIFKEMGNLGWELIFVNSVTNYATFKRKKE